MAERREDLEGTTKINILIMILSSQFVSDYNTSIALICLSAFERQSLLIFFGRINRALYFLNQSECYLDKYREHHVMHQIMAPESQNISRDLRSAHQKRTMPKSTGGGRFLTNFDRLYFNQ
jgi:hypothetical protein